MLTRKQILECADIPTEIVKVPEWGGEVLVKGLTGAERDWLEMSVYTEKNSDTKTNMKNFRAKLASLSICDEKGERLFTEKDIDVLAGKSAIALQRIFNIAQKLSGLSPEDADSLVKN